MYTRHYVQGVLSEVHVWRKLTELHPCVNTFLVPPSLAERGLREGPETHGGAGTRLQAT